MFANSFKIEMFPISIDRKGSKSTQKYARVPDYASKDEYKSLTSEEKLYIDESPVIYESLPVNYTSLYGTETHYSQKPFNGKALTEQNISSIISRLSNNTSYVIAAGSDFIEFMIKGHYFKLTDSNILVTKPLYVGAIFQDIGTDFEMLVGDDLLETEEYTGLTFSSSELYKSSTKPSTYSGSIYTEVLQLLDDEGNVPIKSKFRFTDNVVKNINGGTV